MSNVLDTLHSSFVNVSTICGQEPPLTSSGYVKAMRNYVKHCVPPNSRAMMLEVIDSELYELEKQNLLQPHELVIVIMLYVGMILFGSCGAIMVIYVVIRQPRMRTPRNLFIVNLAISDLTLCLFTQPFNLLRTLYWHYDWILGQVMCKAVAIAQAGNIFVSTISIIAIAVDRMQVIVYPTSNAIQNIGAIGVIICSWLVALLMASPMAAFASVSNGTLRAGGLICSANTIHRDWLRQGKFIYGLLTIIFQYCLPMTIVTYAYIRICLRIRRRQISSRTQKMNDMLSDLASTTHRQQANCSPYTERLMRSEVNVNENSYKLSEIVDNEEIRKANPQASDRMEVVHKAKTKHLNCFKSLRPKQGLRINRQQNDRERRIQRRQIKTHALLATVTAMFILSWLPLHIFNVLMDLQELTFASDLKITDGMETSGHDAHHLNMSLQYADSPHMSSPSSVGELSALSGRNVALIQSFCLLCVLLSACINPVLYGWLNENFHKEFKQMFSHCCKKISGDSNHHTINNTKYLEPPIHTC